jgi:hypothetical protein
MAFPKPVAGALLAACGGDGRTREPTAGTEQRSFRRAADASAQPGDGVRRDCGSLVPLDLPGVSKGKALVLAVGFAKERVRGGAPIFEHRTVKMRLFEMFRKVQAARALSREHGCNDLLSLVTAESLQCAIQSSGR